ncbi:MAG: phosphate signaling complex protein PhoU [Oscillospiraceae bacterium]|nr:phosphate signaling complex protein PhoU [Oscillospiraceae bacterium]
MRNKFEEQLSQLDNMLIEMGTLIETIIAMSVSALKNRDAELAKKTVAFDYEINQKEKDIESLCLKLLLQQQPVARDLRLISSVLKMITDMERIGDQSADIAEIALYIDKPYIKKLEHIPQMAEAAVRMVTDSIDAFVNKDLELAKKVITSDDFVDNLFREVRNDLIYLISEDAENGEQAIDLIMIAKYFERIGDHAVNIAEWVVFSLTGKHVSVGYCDKKL